MNTEMPITETQDFSCSNQEKGNPLIKTQHISKLKCRNLVSSFKTPGNFLRQFHSGSYFFNHNSWSNREARWHSRPDLLSQTAVNSQVLHISRVHHQIVCSRFARGSTEKASLYTMLDHTASVLLSKHKTEETWWQWKKVIILDIPILGKFVDILVMGNLETCCCVVLSVTYCGWLACKQIFTVSWTASCAQTAQAAISSIFQNSRKSSSVMNQKWRRRISKQKPNVVKSQTSEEIDIYSMTLQYISAEGTRFQNQVLLFWPARTASLLGLWYAATNATKEVDSLEKRPRWDARKQDWVLHTRLQTNTSARVGLHLQILSWRLDESTQQLLLFF